MAVKELSGDELRERLFNTFRSRGVLDSLQSRLRNQLVSELEQTAKLSLSKSKKTQPEESSLFQQAADSLVAEHLKLCDYEYSLSVFLPESRLSKDKLLSVQDILHLLKIDPKSQIYNSLLSESTNARNKMSSRGFLWNFVCYIAAVCGNLKSNAAIQTEDSLTTESYKSSLDEKLSQVEKMYNSQAEKEKESWAVHAEQQILTYQRKCEQRKKEELEAEMKRFRTVELARMRLEETEKCQKEIKQTQDMLEKDYAVKCEALRVKEKETLERLERQQKIQEAEAYNQRQKLLEDMQLLKDRENDLKQKHGLNVKSLQLDEEKVKAAEEKLKLKEAAIVNTEKRYDQKLKDEIQRYKLQFQEEFQNRLHELQLKEAQLKQDKDNFDKTKTIYMKNLDQLEGKKEKVNQLQAQLDNQKFQFATIMQQKEHLAEKLDEMKDYQSIRENEIMLKQEVESLRSKLAEQKKSHGDSEQKHQEKIKELQHQLTKPPAEWLALKEELETISENAKRKQKELKDQLRKQDLKLKEERQINSEYQRRYEEQVILGKELQRELNDLRMALRHTQNALTTELQRRLSETDLSETFLPASFVTIPPGTEPNETRRTNSEASDSNSTMELLAHSKAVFEKLEKEAKGLEESYINFQARMRNMGISFNDPRAVLVPCEGASIPAYESETQSEFVPLSWLPGSPDKQSRDDRLAQFYTLPSFGVSQLPRDMQTRYITTTISSTMPANHSVSVGDLEARPGQPSVIAAPIKTSSFPGDQSSKANLGELYHVHSVLQTNSGILHPSSNSSRQPLSSTVDPIKGDNQNSTKGTSIPTMPYDAYAEGTGITKMQLLTSTNLPQEVRAKLSKEKVKEDEAECESKTGSDFSVSSGMLTTGVLKSSTVFHKQTADKDLVDQSRIDPQPVYSEPSGFGASNPQEPQVPNISLDANWQKGSTIGSLEEGDVTSTWGHPSVAVKPSEFSRGREMISLDDAWNETPGIDPLTYEQPNYLEFQHSEAVSQDLHKKEERGVGDRDEHEQNIGEREEKEWIAQQSRQKEERRRREQEAWEREQRELRELERLERDEREREKRDREEQEREERERNHRKQMETTLEEEDIDDAAELDNGKHKTGKAASTEPDIDPIMLQYMEMIRKKKEEEKTVPSVKEKTSNRTASKEAVSSFSNSELSHQDEDLGSIAGLSDNDGFDWG